MSRENKLCSFLRVFVQNSRVSHNRCRRREGVVQGKADDTILETRGLTKEFKGFVAVSDVNLKVRRGSMHAVLRK